MIRDTFPGQWDVPQQFDFDQVKNFVAEREEQFAKYKAEAGRRGEQGGLLATMAALKMRYGDNLAGLRIVDVGCGSNAPVDAILAQEGVSVVGVDKKPGWFEYRKGDRAKNPPVAMPVHENFKNILKPTDPLFDAAISLNMFGLPLLMRDGEKAPEMAYFNSEIHERWLDTFDPVQTKAEYMRELRNIAGVLKPAAAAIISFWRSDFVSAPRDGNAWEEIITPADIQAAGFSLVKDRPHFGNAPDRSQLAVEWSEVVILEKLP